jgi:hypothetical protein
MKLSYILLNGKNRGSHHYLILMYIFVYNNGVINTEESQYIQFTKKKISECNFPIVNHGKNKIKYVLPISDNKQEDLNMRAEASICVKTFKKDRSL